MIRKTIKGGDFKSQMVGELVFDQVPEEGSFNPVTSDAVVKAIDEAKEDMQEKIDEVTLDPSAVALGNVHLLDEVTEFPADGCVLIDSETNGPGEMSKDTLLELTAQNALAGNVAPAFDPAKPNDAGGYAYYKDEIVANNGATYKFKVNHSSGAWNVAEVDRYDAGENLKFFVVTDSPEYLYAVTDKDGAFLFGIKSDGSVEWQKGVPEQIKFELDALKVIIDALDEEKVDKENGKSLVDSIFAGGVSVITNDEFLFALLDNSNNVLFSVRKDGSVDWQTGCPVILSEKFAYISEQIKQLDGAKYFTTESSDDYLEAILDNDSKFIEGLRKNGQREFNTPPIFNAGVEWSVENLEQLSSALKAFGLMGGQGDWSDKMSLQIPMPKFAIVDFSGVERMPQTKTEDLQGYMSFWDLNGNFFKKKVIMNAQGQSSMGFPKKNIAIDLCNDDWVGDDTFKLRLGDTVEQDSFHLKAYYTDFFRGIGLVDYYLYKNILDTRPEEKNRSWKLAMLDTGNSTPWVGDGVDAEKTLNKRFDNGALCFPFGFPCAVYLNGTFYGLFCFQLKKHRDNYMMKKGTKKHIHLDGEIGSGFFNGGDFEWNLTEIRNPKDLYYKTAHIINGVSTYKYDGDYPFEIADEVTVQAWINAGQLPDGTPITTSVQEKLENTAYVHSAITSLGQRMGAIYAMVGEHTTEEIKAEIEKYFDVENLIDYQIFSSVTQNLDGFDRNWQWTTWDGKKWFANAYDLDCTYGAIFNGTCITNPRQDIINGGYVPTKLVVDFYSTELDARYAELRNAGVIGPEVIEKLVGNFVKMIGEGFYKLEYEKWPDSPCNGDIEVDENWELVLDNDGKPVISTDFSQFYNSTATYDIADTCVYNDPIAKSSVGWYYTFKSKVNDNQSTPATKLAHRDSLWRLCAWVRARFARTDNLYNFNNN